MNTSRTDAIEFRDDGVLTSAFSARTLNSDRLSQEPRLQEKRAVGRPCAFLLYVLNILLQQPPLNGILRLMRLAKFHSSINVNGVVWNAVLYKI